MQYDMLLQKKIIVFYFLYVNLTTVLTEGNNKLFITINRYKFNNII